MALCKDCIHNEVCDRLYELNGIPKIGGTDCGCFKDKSDVAPRSEVHDDHHKQVACYTLGCREGDKIKREVAREIFEEIESVCLKHIDRYGRYLMYSEDFAELKKKYTEENK